MRFLDPPHLCLPYAACTPEEKKNDKAFSQKVHEAVTPDFIEHPVGSAMDSIGKAFQDAVGWYFKETSSWWVNRPSPELAGNKSVLTLHELFQPVAIAVALMSLLYVAGKMALTRKANPLIDVGSGLAVVAVVSALGITLPDLLLRWSDEWASWALNTAAGDDFAQRMVDVMTTEAVVPGVIAFLLGLIALLIGVLQAVLLLFRQASIIVLAGVLPLAAAGFIAPATRQWVMKVGGWMLALIFYKDVAAAVYACAFLFIGKGDDLQTLLMGYAMMFIALVAFPVLTKFFSWTTGGSEASGGGSFLGAVVGGITAVGAMRGFHASGETESSSPSNRAAEHADYLAGQLDRSSSSRQVPPPDGSGGRGDGSTRHTTGDGGRTPEGSTHTGAGSASPPSPSRGTGGDPDGGTEPPGSGDEGRRPPPRPPGNGSIPRHRRPSRPPIIWVNRPRYDDDLPSGGSDV